MSQAIIQWRLRRDIEVYPADEISSAWTIKDPVKLTYFRVEAEELAFLQMLDGRLAWQDVSAQLARRFPDSEFSEQNLQMFLATAIKSGILSPIGVGFGSQLARMAQQARSSAVYRKFFSLISHRFRGIDPTSLLRFLDGVCGWIFRPNVLRLLTVFVVVATALVLSRWTQLWAELPTISQLISPQNVLMLGVTVVLVKILHEIGHGLTCHHYGGECHELGCILVGFLPLLYCDVSDTWLQKNRLYRIYVSSAGIAVELFLAALFGLLWMASIPGTLHSFFLNAMLVCSLNTVLVNGNPLLRYDGYYVMCDLLQIPNLGMEARAAAFGVFDRVVLGLKQPVAASTSLLRRLWLPAFGAASTVYRFVVLFTILMVIHATLKPLRLEGIAWFLAFSVAVGMMLSMLMFVKQRVVAVRQNGGISSRSAMGLSVFGIVLAAVMFWPLPYSITAPFTLTPGQSLPVYVAAAGYADVHVKAGDNVEAGQQLATLDNPDLQLLIAETEGELQVRKAQVLHLTGTRSKSPTAAAALPASEMAVQSAKERLASLKQKADRLALKSPTVGTVYPSRNRQSSASGSLDQKFWTGTPLDSANRSVWLNEQTLICWIGSPDLLRAIVYVPQTDIEFVQTQRSVELEFHSLPDQPLTGTVSKVTAAPETSGPPELTAKRLLVTRGSDGQLAETVFGTYVQLDLSKNAIVPPLYSTGYARIQCEPTSLAARAWRLFSHTFAFEL